MSRKTFILDTNVLLYDKTSIHSFSGNDVVIPLLVLDELDRFKEKPGVIGEAARYVNRLLDGFRDFGRLDEGVKVPDNLARDQTIRVIVGEHAAPFGLAGNAGDNLIIAATLSEARENPTSKIILVTKDINLRVKCDALGILSEDYFKDHIASEDAEYAGYRNINLSMEEVDTFWKEGSIKIGEGFFPNEYVLVNEGEHSSFLARHNDGELFRLLTAPGGIGKISPKNKEQSFAIDALMHPDIPLVTLTGIAGSGKTFLTLMAAMDGAMTKKYSRIIISRSIQTVGNDLGFLPGDLNEKMDPWLAPIKDNFQTMFNDITYFETMKDKGQIEVAPLAFIRGRSFNESFVIVDEAQNATVHELKTLITRVGRDSKIVLLGDTDQIDTPYIDKVSNGLSIIVDRFKGTELSAHVNIPYGQRSKLASLASNLL